VKRGLALFDEERGNIEAGQGWAAAQAAEDDAAAKLCSEYPNAAAHCLSLHLHALEQIRWREAGLVAARRLGDRGAEGVHLGNLGTAYWALGQVRRGIEYHEQRLAVAREVGDRQGEGAALGNLGNAYTDLGEPRRAIEYHEECLAIAREVGDERGEGAALGNLGIAYAHLGEGSQSMKEMLVGVRVVAGD
jgi:tetratricopeptide (TPR) repeat protein